MRKPIIVTGAAGFIGRNIAAELNRRGFKNLILVDSLGSDEKWKNLVGLEYEDLLQPDDFLSVLTGKSLNKAEAIIHMGACSATTERDADFLLENNYRYTRTLAEWALCRDVRFVYASSAATYGDGAQGYSDEDSETPALRPLNMYGYSKHMFDTWALRNGLLDEIVGLKFFNVYGPYEQHKGDMRSVVHKSFGQVLGRGYIELFKSDKPDYADGEQMRDFIYVKDVVDVCLHFAFQKSCGGLFNCGTGKARTWKALATAVFVALDKQVDIRFIDMPEQLKGKYQYFTQAEAAKLRKAGYDAPFTELEDGVKDYIQNYLLKQ
ncbi:MAG: ADP-glyceromanno-heptose 6-epimerase [Capsulimonadaceae bacterium]|nr:ADP-glyceromanno-heptose 6-epimerase [Capsulimonadaceae bacterium]